jgi:hypothetical protein
LKNSKNKFISHKNLGSGKKNLLLELTGKDNYDEFQNNFELLKELLKEIKKEDDELINEDIEDNLKEFYDFLYGALIVYQTF